LSTNHTEKMLDPFMCIVYCVLCVASPIAQG
jgi:hypothetical protein